MVALDVATNILSVDYAKESNSLDGLTSLPSSSPLRQKTRQTPSKPAITRTSSLSSSPQVGGIWGDNRWQIIEFGTPGSLRYRMLFINRQDGREMSPWHQIPLSAGPNSQYLNFLCKTPRGSWARYEVADNEHYNPLRLTAKQGWPAHFTTNTTWNYGMLPQTWADPTLQNEQFKNVVYDGKPLEVIEIGSRSSWTGEVYQVKPLGAFAVIEGPNLSWKIIAIAADDPMSSILKSVNDINRSLPGMLDEIREWLRTCKCLDENDQEGQFGLYELPAEHEETMRQIEIAHKSWQILSVHQVLPDPSFPRMKPMKSSTYETLWIKFTESSSDASIPLSDFGLGTRWKQGKSNETMGPGSNTPGKHRRELLGFLRPKNKISQVQPGTPTSVKSLGPNLYNDDSDYAPKSSRCGLSLFVRSVDDNSLPSSTRKESLPPRLHKNISWDEKNLSNLISSAASELTENLPKVSKPLRLISHSSWDLSNEYPPQSSPSRPLQHVIPSETENRENSQPPDPNIESTAPRPGKRNETSRLLKNRLRGNVSLGINIPTNNDASKMFRLGSDKKSSDNGSNSSQSTPTGSQQPKPAPVSPSLMSPRSWLSAIGLSSTLSPKASPRNALKSRDVRGYEGERGDKVWGPSLDSSESSRLKNFGNLVSGKMKYDRLNSPSSKGHLPSPGSNRGGTIGGTAIARMVKDFTVDKRDDKPVRVLISPRGREVRIEESRNGRTMSSKFHEPQWGSPLGPGDNGILELRNGPGKILRTSSMPISFDMKKDFGPTDGYRSSQSSPSANSLYEGSWTSPGDHDGRLVRTRSQGRRVTFSEKVEVKLFKSEGKQPRGGSGGAGAADAKRDEEKEGKIEKREKPSEKEMRVEMDNLKANSMPNTLSRKEMQQRANARYYKSVASSLKTSSPRNNPDDYVWHKALESVSSSGFVESYDLDDEKRNGEKHSIDASVSSSDEEFLKVSRSDKLAPRFDRSPSPKLEYSRSDYGYPSRSTTQNLSPLNPLSRMNAEARLERERERPERGESSPKFVHYSRGRRTADPFESVSPDRFTPNPNYPSFRPSHTGSGELIPSLGRRLLVRKAIKGGSGELLPLPYSTSPSMSVPLRRSESATVMDMNRLTRDEGDPLLLNKSSMENGNREHPNGILLRRREDMGRTRISREERRERMLVREDSYLSHSDSDSSWTSTSSPQDHLLKLNLLESQQNLGNRELTKKKWDVSESIEKRMDQGKEKMKPSQHPQSPNKEIRMGGRISVQQPYTVYVS